MGNIWIYWVKSSLVASAILMALCLAASFAFWVVPPLWAVRGVFCAAIFWGFIASVVEYRKENGGNK